MVVVILTVINIIILSVSLKTFNDNCGLVSQKPYEVVGIISLILDVETEAQSLIVFKEMSKLLTWVLKAFHDLTLPISPASFLPGLVSPTFSLSFFKTQFSHYLLQGVFRDHYFPIPWYPPGRVKCFAPGFPQFSFRGSHHMVLQWTCPLCLLPLRQCEFSESGHLVVFLFNPST